MTALVIRNPDNGFSWRDLEGRFFKKGIGWFDGIELISSDRRQDVKEAVDWQAMFWQVERRKGLDAPDDGFGHVSLI